MLTFQGPDQEELRPQQESEAQELETAGDGQRPWSHGYRWWKVGACLAPVILLNEWLRVLFPRPAVV